MDRVLVTTLTIIFLLTEHESLIIISPEGILIEDQSSANLTCTGFDPIISANWTKDGHIVIPSDRIEFSTDNTSLLISPVKRTDSGDYRCTLSNNSSSTTANYTMTVNYGPDVRVLGATVLEEGSDILLLCSAVSLPSCSIAWTVNGISEGNSPLFILENSNHTHGGNYQCTATNNLTGVTASTVHFLTVTGKNTDSGLSPGAAAGITVAVISVLVLLAVGLYFIYLKNSANPVCKIPCPMKSKQREPSNSRVEEGNEQSVQTEFKTRTKERIESLYENQSMERNQNPSYTRVNKPKDYPEPVSNRIPPQPPHRVKMEALDSDQYSTYFP